MKLLFFALVAVAFAQNEKAPLLALDSPTAIEGEYIVVFKEEVGNDAVEAHKDVVRSKMSNRTVADFKITSEWQIADKHFRGYAGVMDEKIVDEIRYMREVKYVERNQVVKALQQADCDLQTGATWGLVRTTLHDWDGNPNNPPNEYSHDRGEGEGVTVYIIDTGIDETHPLFEGRASRGVDFIDNPPPSNGDPNGHGTHVAGTVMANTYGLARSATSVAVRVLNAGGSGSFQGVIDGINWTAQQGGGPGKKSVGNMSLGGGLSTAMNEAANACVAAGVHMAVAAGNEYGSACTRSPASATDVVTVAASDSSDRMATFSNYGDCVNIIGPGVDIISTTPNGGTASYSGTSMASPHVAGVIAKVLSQTDEYDDPIAMRDYIKSISTKDKITSIPGTGTPNELIFFECA